MTAILKFNGSPDPGRLEALIDELARSPELRLALLHQLLGEGACRQLGLYPLPDGFKLSVVIPVYNERQWVRELVRRVHAVPIPKQVILVDDCSTDGTVDILRELEQESGVTVVPDVSEGVDEGLPAREVEGNEPVCHGRQTPRSCDRRARNCRDRVMRPSWPTHAG